MESHKHFLQWLRYLLKFPWGQAGFFHISTPHALNWPREQISLKLCSVTSLVQTASSRSRSLPRVRFTSNRGSALKIPSSALPAPSPATAQSFLVENPCYEFMLTWCCSSCSQEISCCVYPPSSCCSRLCCPSGSLQGDAEPWGALPEAGIGGTGTLQPNP